MKEKTSVFRDGKIKIAKKFSGFFSLFVLWLVNAKWRLCLVMLFFACMSISNAAFDWLFVKWMRREVTHTHKHTDEHVHLTGIMKHVKLDNSFSKHKVDSWVDFYTILRVYKYDKYTQTHTRDGWFQIDKNFYLLFMLEYVF